MTYTKSLLKNHLLSHLKDLKKSIIGEINIKSDIKSVIINNLNPSDKKYIMLGSGCGFSRIKADMRSVLARKIITDAGLLKKEIEAELLKIINKDIINDLQKCGNPIQAHFAQNLNYKSAYNYIVVEFMKQYNIKNIRVENQDD